MQRQRCVSTHPQVADLQLFSHSCRVRRSVVQLLFLTIGMDDSPQMAYITELKPEMLSKARFPLPELTSDQFPFPTNTGCVEGGAFPLAELTGCVNSGKWKLGPSTRVVETGLKSASYRIKSSTAVVALPAMVVVAELEEGRSSGSACDVLADFTCPF